MGVDWIVCLANSYKHDHRCVAGINLTTKKWVRLVGREVPGCVTARQTLHTGGRETAILDVVEVELTEPCGNNCHPEDTYITDRCWRRLRGFEQSLDAAILETFVSHRPTILQGYGDRVSERRFDDEPIERSLELIEPDDLWWWNREEKGKRKSRALFRVSPKSRIRYDLPVTDPVWLHQLNLMPLGVYPHSTFASQVPHRTLFAVSLSEPFYGFHYKLVAGVVQLPMQQKAEQVPDFIRAAKPVAQEARPHRFHFRWHARHS